MDGAFEYGRLVSYRVRDTVDKTIPVELVYEARYFPMPLEGMSRQSSLLT